MLTGSISANIWGSVIKDPRLARRYLPPTFPNDLINPSVLLAYYSGKNSSATTKKEEVSGYDMVAKAGPCLSMATDETLPMVGFGTVTSWGGTATLLYDGVTLTATAAGTVFGLDFSSGITFPCSEGSGTQMMDSTGAYKIDISGLADPWSATQDLFFDAMVNGWHQTDPDDGVQYPADPDTSDASNLTMEISGLGSVTLDGVAYTLGVHQFQGFTGTKDLIAAYGPNEVALSWANGDLVTGTFPNYTVNMSTSMAILAEFTEPVAVIFTYAFETTGVGSAVPDTKDVQAINGATVDVGTGLDGTNAGNANASYHAQFNVPVASGDILDISTGSMTFDLVQGSRIFMDVIGLTGGVFTCGSITGGISFNFGDAAVTMVTPTGSWIQVTLRWSATEISIEYDTTLNTAVVATPPVGDVTSLLFCGSNDSSPDVQMDNLNIYNGVI